MSYPTFPHLTVTPEEAGAAKLGAPNLRDFVEPLVATPLSAAELELDENTPDPLISVEGERLTDLKAYWETGMRSTLPTSLIRASVLPLLDLASKAFPSDWGLAIFDAYRPLALQRKLYTAAYSEGDLEPGFVIVPSENPLTPPPHVTGAALDLTLTWKGQALALGTSFDSFVPAAGRTSFEDHDSLTRDLRRALSAVMIAAGFVPYAQEWWHFEHGTGRWAAMTGERPKFGQPLA